MKKNVFVVLLCIALSFCFFACGAPVDETYENAPTAEDGVFGENSVNASDVYSNFDLDATWNNKAVSVKFNGSDADIKGNTLGKSAVSFKDGIFTVKKEGTFVLSGNLNGGIVVNVSKSEKVHIILYNVTVTADKSSAIYVQSADKVCFTVPIDTESTLTDAENYTYADGEDEHKACIYSKDDVTFNGSGTLNIISRFNNGIRSKNDIKIVSGNINVTALNNAIKGKDSVCVNSGKLVINSDGDGIKVDGEEKAEKGFILIEGGDIVINCKDDALQATRRVTATGGKITANAEGKAVNCDGTVEIAEGVLVS